MKLVWVAWLLLLWGCMGHFPPCPAAGGPAWREMSTRHFQLTTDIPADEARQTLAQLERLRAALLVSFDAPDDVNTGRIPVVVLGQGWTDFASADTGGFFTNALFRPLIVMRAGMPLEDEETIKHELVHFFSGKIIPIQPAWFSEGLATYLQTIECPERAERITIGQPPVPLLRLAQQSGLYGLAEMMAASSVPSEQREHFYSTAWLTVHYLMNHYPAELRAYEKTLNAPPSGTPAWNRAFPTLTASDLEWDLRRYLADGQYTLFIYPFRPSETPVERERILTDADVHVTRAFLLAVAGRRSSQSIASQASADLLARAADEIVEARRQEPAHLQAQAVTRWLLNRPVELAGVRLAVQKQPTDWMAWLLLADALQNHDVVEGQQAAIDNALAFSAEDASVALSISSHTKLAPTPAPADPSHH